eukprot:4852218-Pyramimonas_sp.AAC.2
MLLRVPDALLGPNILQDNATECCFGNPVSPGNEDDVVGLQLRNLAVRTPLQLKLTAAARVFHWIACSVAPLPSLPAWPPAWTPLVVGGARQLGHGVAGGTLLTTLRGRPLRRGKPDC